MTIDEAANYGDITMFYMIDDDCDDNIKKGWQWDLNCGYQTSVATTVMKRQTTQ